MKDAMMEKIELTNGIWTFVLSEDGRALSLTDGEKELLRKDPSIPICEFLLTESGQNHRVFSALLLRHDARSAAFTAELDLGNPVRLHFDWQMGNPDESGTPLLCTIDLRAATDLNTDVALKWFWNFQIPMAERSLFVPLFDGHGLRTSLKEPRGWHYECTSHQAVVETNRLAIPVLDEYSHDLTLRVAHFSDPFFGTALILPSSDSAGAFSSKFLSAVGPQQFQRRIFGLYLHNGDAATALEAFFRYAIPHCPPGPDWLHEIAMVDYDFLSKKGEGWYRDVDKLTELIEPNDRHCVLLTLHGWYDFLGRYSYDESTHRMLNEWIAMPGGDKISMSLTNMHKRITYAKERRFRVALYFADGLAIDSGSPTYSEEIVFREPSGELRRHHWGGPDTVAQTYIMNPVHPKVQALLRGYLKALLNEFGKEIDALNWDETFTTKVGDISTGSFPGYADRAFMLFCKELRDIVKSHNPEIAFLASDCTGLMLPQEDGSFWQALPAQNAVVFDGTFQDSHCYPTAWQYGLFPNYRNVVWSCNWTPFERFDWTNTGVRVFGVPVAISNGWGENRGISDATEVEVRKVMDLFDFRKNLRNRLRWLETRDLHK